MQPRPREGERPDSQVVNPITPDPLAILRDGRRIFDRNRPGGVRDGFTIVDGESKPAWGTEADFKSAIDKNFRYTEQNFQEALNKAAREGKPLVVIFGSQNTRGTRGLVEDVLAPGSEKNNGDKNAVHVFVDRSRLDPKSELGLYAAREIGNTDLAYTGIFAVKPGAAGEPKLGSSVANTWGARTEIKEIVNGQLRFASALMQQNRDGFKIDETAPVKERESNQANDGKSPEKSPLKETEKVKERSAEQEADKRVSPFADKLFESIANLKGASYGERESIYEAAEKLADQINPDEVKLALRNVERQIKEEQSRLEREAKDIDPDSPEGKDQREFLTDLQNKQAKLTLLETADSWVRINHGLSQMRFSQLDEGVESIKEGLSRNPEYANHPQFLAQLLKSPYDAEVLKKNFPQCRIDDYLEGKLVDSGAEQISEKLPKLEKIEESEERKFDGSRWKDAVEASERSGKPLVVKVGTPGCHGCDLMTENSWPDSEIQSNLAENAIFVDLDGLKHSDLAVESLKADSWPTVLVLEPSGDGKVKELARLEWEGKGISTGDLREFLRNRLPDKETNIKETSKKENTESGANNPKVSENVDAGRDRQLPDSDEKSEPKEEIISKELAKEAFTRLSRGLDSTKEPFAGLSRNSPPEQVETAFAKAIELAESFDPEDLALARKVLEQQKRIHNLKVESGEFDESEANKYSTIITENEQNLARVEEQGSRLSISRGIWRMKTAPENQEPTAGIEDIKAAFGKHSHLAEDPAVKAELLRTGIPQEDLEKWFPMVSFRESSEIDSEIDSERNPAVKRADSEEPTSEADTSPKDYDIAPERERIDAGLRNEIFSRLSSHGDEIVAPLKSLPENPSIEQLDAAFSKAIANCSRIKPEDISEAKGALHALAAPTLKAKSRGQLTAEQAENQLEPVAEQWQKIAQLEQSESYLRIALGVTKMRGGGDYLEPGINEISSTLEENPALVRDPQIKKKLIDTGYSTEKLKEWFPQIDFATAATSNK